MKRPGPILVTELFPDLEAHLLDLLRSLGPAEWDAPTACQLWTVKDLAAHLLDSALRRLSMARDGYFSVAAPVSPAELAAWIDRANAEWVGAARRLSPRMLIELLSVAGRELYDYFRTLESDAPAPLAVSWAGQESSPNWFDIAREYTERWHHQQQIREATGRPGIDTPKLMFPVLDTFMRALPYTYRGLAASDGTLVRVEVCGPAGGNWYLLRTRSQWELWLEAAEAPHATVSMPQEIAWKLPTKGVGQAQAERLIRLEGDQELGRGILELRCIVG